MSNRNVTIHNGRQKSGNSLTMPHGSPEEVRRVRVLHQIHVRKTNQRHLHCQYHPQVCQAGCHVAPDSKQERIAWKYPNISACLCCLVCDVCEFKSTCTFLAFNIRGFDNRPKPFRNSLGEISTAAHLDSSLRVQCG